MSVQPPRSDPSSLNTLNEVALRIAVRIPRECSAVTNFHRHYLDSLSVVKYQGHFLVNNHIRPDPEGIKFGACSSHVVFVRSLAKAVREGHLKMCPWPNFHVSEAALQELEEGNPDLFATQALEHFKWSDSVHDNQRVSSHIYWVGLLGWREGEASKSALHALFTDLFECNILNSFTSDADRFQFRIGEPFPWPIILRRESSEKHCYETLTPKPDFSMFVDGLPRLIIQVCSDPHSQSDLWLALLSAAAILRTMYESRSNADAVFSELFRSSMVVIYIKDDRASVYILYLVPRFDGDAVTPHEVCYTRDVYDLKNIDELLGLTKLLYLLAQRIKDEGRPIISWEQTFSSVAEWAGQNGFITVLKTTKKNTSFVQAREVSYKRLSSRTVSGDLTGRSRSQYDWRSVKQTELPNFGLQLEFRRKDSSRSHSFRSVDLPPDCVRFGTDENGEDCVLKICHSREVRYLKTLRHPNIISLLRTLDLSIGRCIVMPHLRSLGRGVRWGDLDSTLVLPLSKGLISGLIYLNEDMLIAHLDIKPDNVVFTHEGQAKIIDFGLAITVDYPGQLYNMNCGTEKYMAPEIEKGPYDPLLADRYSAGKTLLALAECESTGLEIFAEKLMDLRPSARPNFSQWAKWMVQKKRSSSQMDMEVDGEERPWKRPSPGPAL